MKYTIVLVLFISLPLKLKAFELEKDLPHFHEVTADIYRGGRPTVAGLAELERKGVKTIIDLEDNRGAIQNEALNLKPTSVQFISVPFASFRFPKEANVEKVLNILNDPNSYPVYIHCQHGQDRTGLLVGLYRVFMMNWKPSDAYGEMKRIGFHPILYPLNHYFEKKTHFED